MKQIKAAFFDRDGTLIKDVNYLSDINQIELLPGIIDLCKILQKKDYELFVVTNQSGIARGFFDEAFVNKTHVFLTNLFLKKNIIFKKFYYCPHHPKKAKNKKYLKNCFCRKPYSGMLLQAAKEFNIDLSKSLMFGDKIFDINAGLNVACKSFYIQDFLYSNDIAKKFIEEIGL